MGRALNRPKRKGHAVVSRKARPRPSLKVNEYLQRNWDDRLTARQNLLRMGIKTDINSEDDLHAAVEAAPSVAETDGMPEAKRSVPPRINVKRPRMYVGALQASYIDGLTRKHGMDFKAMERDIKVANTQQWTAQKCEGMVKRLETFRKLQAEAAEAEAAAEAAEEAEPTGKEEPAVHAAAATSSRTR